MKRPFAERLYRFLTLAYPAEFRQAYGDDLLQAFRDRTREQRFRGGLRGRLVFWSFLLEDLIRSVPVEIRHALAERRAATLKPLRQHRGDPMGSILHDLKYGRRTLVKRPAFTFIVVLTLALGIAANTVIFTVLNGVLIESMPYRDAEELVLIGGRTHTGHRVSVSFPNFYDWKERSHSFLAFGGYRWESYNLTGDGTPEVVSARQVLGDFFAVLDVEPLLGRTLTHADNEPGAAPLAVIGHGFWQSRFGGAEDVLGRSLRLDDELFTIVGVMPPRFWSSTADAYVPLGHFADQFPWEQRGPSFGLRAIARLAPGVTVSQAQADLDQVTAAIRETEGEGVAGATLGGFHETFRGYARQSLLVLMGAVGFVLLIGCANVANLLLARAQGRRREIALRTALGAERWRIVRQLLTESLLLAFLGGALGLALATAGLQSLIAILPRMPSSADMTLDGNVLLFTLVLSLLTGLLFGLLPALRSARPDLVASLKDGDPGSFGGRHRLRSVLVIAEVALSLVLLCGAGLLMKSLDQLHAVDKGFDEEGAVAVEMSLPAERYGDQDRWIWFHQELLRRVEALPGAHAATVTALLPMGSSRETGAIPEGTEITVENLESTLLNTVSPDHFKAMGIPLIEGRSFTHRDRDGAERVVIVDETMAEKLWPGQSALGQRVAIEFEGDHQNPQPVYRTVVGVVKHVRHYQLDAPSRIESYVPFTQLSLDDLERLPPLALVVRTSGEPTALVPQIRDELRAIDPELPVARVQTLADIVYQELTPTRSMTQLLGLFGAVALLLAAIGIYGVMSVAVGERRREIGIRLALGARAFDILGLIGRYGFRLALYGVAVGVVGAVALRRVVGSLLFEVDALDPMTFGAVAVLLVGVASVAAYFPAHRATRVDPVTVLRD